MPDQTLVQSIADGLLKFGLASRVPRFSHTVLLAAEHSKRLVLDPSAAHDGIHDNGMGFDDEVTAVDGDADAPADEQMADADQDTTPDVADQQQTIQQPSRATAPPSQTSGATESLAAGPNSAQAPVEHAGDSMPQNQAGGASPEPAVPVRRLRAARADAPRVFVGAGQAWADEKGWLNEPMWRALVERVVSLVISNPGWCINAKVCAVL